MVELNIKISGNDLKNLEIDKILKLIKNLDSTDVENSEKAQSFNVKSGGDLEDFQLTREEILNAIEELSKPEDVERFEELKKSAKAEFIKLTKSNREKAKSILDSYSVTKFSDLDIRLIRSDQWIKLLKELEE